MLYHNIPDWAIKVPSPQLSLAMFLLHRKLFQLLSKWRCELRLLNHKVLARYNVSRLNTMNWTVWQFFPRCNLNECYNMDACRWATGLLYTNLREVSEGRLDPNACFVMHWTVCSKFLPSLTSHFLRTLQRFSIFLFFSWDSSLSISQSLSAEIVHWQRKVFFLVP